MASGSCRVPADHTHVLVSFAPRFSGRTQLPSTDPAFPACPTNTFQGVNGQLVCSCPPSTPGLSPSQMPVRTSSRNPWINVTTCLWTWRSCGPAQTSLFPWQGCSQVHTGTSGRVGNGAGKPLCCIYSQKKAGNPKSCSVLPVPCIPSHCAPARWERSPVLLFPGRHQLLHSILPQICKNLQTFLSSFSHSLFF